MVFPNGLGPVVLVALSILSVTLVGGAKPKAVTNEPPTSQKIPIPRRLQLTNTEEHNWGSVGEIYGGERHESYGSTFALDGTGRRIVVGSPYNPGDDCDTGLVQVFEREEVEGTIYPNWVQLGQDIDGGSGEDMFGMMVSISNSGTRIAALAPHYDVAGVDDDDANDVKLQIGRLRVFDYDEDNGEWTEVDCELLNVKAAIMSADGSRFIIGNPPGSRFVDGVREETGQVGVFALEGNVFVQLGEWIDTEVESDSFGKSVAISYDGSRIAVGAALNDGEGWGNLPESELYDDNYNPYPTCLDENNPNNTTANFGLVRVYEFRDVNDEDLEQEQDWVQLGSDIVGGPCDKFGYSLDMDSVGSRIVVGAPGSDYFYDDEGASLASEAGGVRVLDYVDGVWTDVGEEIQGNERLQQLGLSVSISSSGDRIVVGSDTGWLSDTKENPVCVYNLVENVWETVGECIVAETVDDDCGVVAMDGSGDVVAVGCYDLGQLANNAGGLRVYFHMSDCVAKYNTARLAKVDRYLVKHNKDKKRVKKLHNKMIKKTEKRSAKKWENCGGEEACQEMVIEWESEKIEKVDNKISSLDVKITDKFLMKEAKSMEKFMEKASNCE